MPRSTRHPTAWDVVRARLYRGWPRTVDCAGAPDAEEPAIARAGGCPRPGRRSHPMTYVPIEAFSLDGTASVKAPDEPRSRAIRIAVRPVEGSHPKSPRAVDDCELTTRAWARERAQGASAFPACILLREGGSSYTRSFPLLGNIPNVGRFYKQKNVVVVLSQPEIRALR